MAQDYETKRSDLQASRDKPGDNLTAAEDPLVELARIVHKNKQSGANVSSGRVGSTDYFAGLEDVASKDDETAAEFSTRQEPTFASQPSASQDPAGPALSADTSTQTVSGGMQVATEAGDQEPFFEAPTEPATGRSSHPSTLWPEIGQSGAGIGLPEVSGQVATGLQPAPLESAAVDGQTAYSEVPDFASEVEPSSLAPTISIDLEQNLSAELEDELIGALRQSVDEVQPGAEIPVEPIAPYAVQGTEYPATGQYAGSYRVDAGAPAAAAAPHETGARDMAAENRIFDREDRVSPSRGTERYMPSGHHEPRLDTPVQPPEPVSAQRPRIDENDLFAALNPVQSDPVPEQELSPTAQSGDPAGIEALFADLDFPSPSERKAGAQETQLSQTAGSTDLSALDEMTWPAAAAAVPQTEAEETPPPPEGYDLDAVARAMQESDPSLTGAGVLPPHSAAETGAVPHAGEKSRRGMVVAAGVLGVAILGAAGFFMLDGDSVSVPSGPPPVISGLQEPLKVFPEDAPAPANDQTAKLDYSRVDGSGVTGPDRLVLPNTPQPAELPPAPADTNGRAELAPGTPKRVRTVIVRPDGTFVSENEPDPSAATVPPVSVPADARPVQTEPVVAAPEDSPAVAAQPSLPVPATVQTPVVSGGADNAGTASAVTGAPVPGVLPRKKPPVPLQVAAAPPAAVTPVTTPAPTATDTGPLNLSQQAATPAAAAPAGTSGSIAPGTYIVQVTSQRSESAATDAYSGLQRRYPAILGNRNAVIVSANVQDRGVFYRARIPASSREEAVSLCESLQAAGGDCFVRRQP